MIFRHICAFSIYILLCDNTCYCLKDEKLQNVLGHLKKDFEGGVSSENLGESTIDINWLYDSVVN